MLKILINNRKSNFKVKLELEVGNWIYTISKEGTRTKQELEKIVFFH